jgi:hypothetical protein
LSGTSPAREAVAIEVPSAYISQQSHELDVTLVRTAASRSDLATNPITINFSVTGGLLPNGAPVQPSAAGQYFTPVDETVTFPAGAATELVAIPINSTAVNPGLVPIQLEVASSQRAVKGTTTTVYLASSSSAIPPSIVSVQRVAGGIDVTFSKPMAASTVQNIRNYSVRFSPSQKYTLENVTGVGLIQTLTASNISIPLRRATYDPATNSVLLVAKEQLGSAGSYRISSPASLLAKRGGPAKAQPLRDTRGNPLEQGTAAPGVFSITIRKGHPYSGAPETLSDGSSS